MRIKEIFIMAVAVMLLCALVVGAEQITRHISGSGAKVVTSDYAYNTWSGMNSVYNGTSQNIGIMATKYTAFVNMLDTASSVTGYDFSVLNTATVTVQTSMDNVNWFTQHSWSLTGVTNTGQAHNLNAPAYLYIRPQVTAINNGLNGISVRVVSQP